MAFHSWLLHVPGSYPLSISVCIWRHVLSETDQQPARLNLRFLRANACIATDWMKDLRDRNATARYLREQFGFAGEADVWTFDNGNASLYFRNGAVIGELSGAPNDVRFFARILNKQWAR